MQIDINCDMGESADPSHDRALMPLLTSCNVACGGHAGDDTTMETTIREAIAQGVSVGAHPAYPDRAGFGRRRIEIGLPELQQNLVSQILAVKKIAERLRVRLAHVKPHGALYNVAAECNETSRCILKAVRTACPDARLMGLASSATEQMALESDFAFLPEAFADRRYTKTGCLVPRTQSDAVVTDPETAAMQVLSIVRKGCVTVDGTDVPIQAATICIHGDNPAASQILRAIDVVLAENGIRKTCP